VSSMHLRRALCAAAVAVAVAAASAGATNRPLVHVAANSSLHARVLVDRAGRTLYHLSVEKNGRFVCSTSACLSSWHPLAVAKGTTPTGVAKLGTVRRPDGRLQVTFGGAPLYTFVGDSRAGQAKGDGFKDVGVWHAASIGNAAAARTPAPKPRSYGY
jgi:predicted lipoprotein with Yx(FWY)xxD motif